LKLLTLARDLKRRKAREKRSLFVAEGIRCVEELLKSKLAIEGALVSPQLGAASRGAALLRDLEARGIEVLAVSEKEFESAAETDSPQGVLAIAKIPRHTLPSAQQAERFRIVVLDGVQDPGNTGTILRTAAALGAAATLALPGTVDVWNAKVVRSSVGSHFRHPVLSTTEEELANFLRREGIELWGAAAAGDPLGGGPVPAKLAIAVGNEGAGLSSTVRGLASRTIAVPIGGEVESLNVAVATGIILYELSK
jgi:TrmH family RNA methyltransferase